MLIYIFAKKLEKEENSFIFKKKRILFNLIKISWQIYIYIYNIDIKLFIYLLINYKKMKKTILLLGTLMATTISTTFAFQPPRDVVCDNLSVQLENYEVNTSFENKVNQLQTVIFGSYGYDNDWNYDANHIEAMKKVASIFDKRFSKINFTKLKNSIYTKCMNWKDEQKIVDKIFKYRDALESTIVNSDTILKALAIYLVDWKKWFVEYIRENKSVIQDIKSWVKTYKEALKLQNEIISSYNN